MSSLQVEAPKKELAQTQTVTAEKKKTNELFAKNNGKMGCQDDDSNLPEAYVRCVTTAKRKLGLLQVDADGSSKVTNSADSDNSMILKLVLFESALPIQFQFPLN